MKRTLTAPQRETLVGLLKTRFHAHPGRHPGLTWPRVEARLREHPDRLWSLHEMERTGGEPEATGHDPATGAVRFIDASPQTPKGRTSVCYDRAGLESRKEHRPATSAIDLAAAMGIRLLSEAEYLELQQIGEFDTRTSSWVLAPPRRPRPRRSPLWRAPLRPRLRRPQRGPVLLRRPRLPRRPASLRLADPAGNPILVDQHAPSPAQ